MQAAGGDPPLDRLGMEAELAQLRPGDDPVLPLRERPHPARAARGMASVLHRVPKASVTVISPSDAHGRAPRH
jgi:hypothetical protein